MSDTNNIEIVSVVFGAGDSRLLAMSGNYFEIIDAPGPIDVILSSYNGEQRARMAQASASFYSKGVEFGVIQITSASAQTIRFAYGSGETGTRRATGSVTISGAVALDAATLAALEQINVRPESATGFFSDASALTADVPLTVFTPAANTGGAIVLSASMQYGAGTVAHNQVFIAKSSAPLNTVDGEVILQCGASSYVSAGTGFGIAHLPTPQFIPAGKGLYFVGSMALAADRNSNMRACRYKLL